MMLSSFIKFLTVEYMITEREGLIDDVTWAPYRLVTDTKTKLKFERFDRTEAV